MKSKVIVYTCRHTSLVVETNSTRTACGWYHFSLFLQGHCKLLYIIFASWLSKVDNLITNIVVIATMLITTLDVDT
jgi:L-rhamnose mutarotase